jgi:HD-GYP domain-containing protein (c-di-GMP phosphodiesterase class II)
VSVEYSPIRVSTIKPQKSLTFDLHIRFKEQFLLYLKVGEAVDRDKLKKLKKQKVARFFIDSNDEEKYQSYLDDLLDAAVTDKNMAANDRADIVSGAAKNAVEEMRENPASKKAFKATEKASKSIIEVVKNNPEMLKELFKIKSEEDVTLQTAVNTSSLAVRMAQLKGLSEGEIESISTGALLRDVGITKMDKKYQELFSKPLDTFTSIELKIYKTHPTLSVRVMEELETVPQDVLSIIHTHEEKISGIGFPRGVNKLSPSEEIVSLCSSYDRLVTCLDQDPKESIKSIGIDELGNYNLDNITFLKKMLKDDGLI